MSDTTKLKSVTLIQAVFFNGQSKGMILGVDCAALDLSADGRFVRAEPHASRHKAALCIPTTNVACMEVLDPAYEAKLEAAKPVLREPDQEAKPAGKSALRGTVKFLKNEAGEIIEQLV